MDPLKRNWVFFNRLDDCGTIVVSVVLHLHILYNIKLMRSVFLQSHAPSPVLYYSSTSPVLSCFALAA